MPSIIPQNRAFDTPVGMEITPFACRDGKINSLFLFESPKAYWLQHDRRNFEGPVTLRSCFLGSKRPQTGNNSTIP
jgi:hypothetical protein